MSLFPAKDSLEEAIEYAYAKLPLTSRNEVQGVLMLYHNTLLKIINNA